MRTRALYAAQRLMQCSRIWRLMLVAFQINVAEYSTGGKFHPCEQSVWPGKSNQRKLVDCSILSLLNYFHADLIFVITQLFSRGPHWYFPAAERLLILAVCFSARIDRAFDSQSRQRRLNCCD